MKTGIFLKTRHFSFQGKIKSASVLAATLALILDQTAFAADGTWTSATDGTWATGANWSSSPTPPGATSGVTSPDTATFNLSSGGAVTVDTGRNIKNISFDTNAGAYTFNSGSLFLSNGGAIQILSTATGSSAETFNTPITLEGRYAFSNNSTTGATLTINSAISSDVSGGLALSGSNAGTGNVLSGVLSDGAGTLSVGKSGAGTWQMTGTSANTYSGGTVVAGGLLSVGSATSIGTGSATIFNTGELRLSSASNVATGQTVTVNAGGILGISSTGFNQSQLAGLVAPNSNGIIAIDTASFSNALNLAALGNGGMYLGSSTTGTYTATSLGIASGGSVTGPGGAPITLGGAYHLGAGGGTLTLTQDVLKDQAPVSIASNPTNALAGTGPGGSSYTATSNTRNSLVVGLPGGGLGAGTLDLATNQDFTGRSTVNTGSTLALDFSGTPASTSDILNSANQVILNGGALSVIGKAGVTDSQTLANVGLVSGSDTISASQQSTGSLVVNLGTLGNGAAGSALSAAPGVALQIVQAGAGTATINTTTATNSADSSYGGQVVFTSGGTTRWATGTLNGGTYTLSQLTTDTTALPASGASGTTDYVLNGNLTLSANESINLLRVTNTTAATLKAGATTGNTLTINGGGILFTNTAAFTFGLGDSTVTPDWITSGAPATNGYTFLNLQNYGTGGVTIGTGVSTAGVFTDPSSGAKMVVVYGGTGVYTINCSSANYTGGTVLDGATLNFVANSASGLINTGTLTINSGTIEAPVTSSGFSLTMAEIWNGNFTLGTVVRGGVPLSGPILLNKNIVLTVMGSLPANGWNIAGPISDGGYGYGLDLNIASNNNLTLSGSNTFTGPVLVEGGTLNVAPGSLNRNNVLSLAPGASLNMIGTTLAIAGLNDLGKGSSTESVTNSVSGGGSTLQIFGSGSYSFGGIISDGSKGKATALAMNGLGTQVLTGANIFTGGITVNAGTLVVDASQGGSVTSNATSLAGGTYEFKGTAAGTTETINNLTSGVGGSTLILDNNGGAAGANTLALNRLNSGTAGATLQIKEVGTSAGNITTTTGNTNGILGGSNGAQGGVVFTSASGVTTWATAIGTSGPFTIGAFTGESALTTAPTAIGGDYLMTGNLSGSIGTESLNLLRITGGTDLNQTSGTTLTAHSGGLLFTGSSAFSIEGGTIIGGFNGSVAQMTLQNYGTAALTIGSTIADTTGGATALAIAGPGTTILTAANTYSGVTYLNGGVVNINSLANFGTGGVVQFSGATLQYAANFTGDSDLSNDAVSFNASGGSIDTNGNAVTYAVPFGTFGGGTGGLTVVDTAATHGSITLNGIIGYAGPTTIQNGGSVNLGKNGNLSPGAGTVVGNGGKLSGGATATTSSATASTSNAGMITLQSGGTLTPGNLTGTGSNLLTVQNTGLGSGGDQSAGAKNNVLAASGLNWNAGGTLKFQLDSTSQSGTELSLSSSTLLNLGSGALVKSGAGTFTIDFGNTAAVNSAVGTTNVFDLINFGATTTYGVTTANTNFDINDFTLVNVSSDPSLTASLSFYFNANALGGIGQEELLLTTLETNAVPEPGTWAMLVGGLAFLLIAVRLSRRQDQSTSEKS